MAPHRLKDQPTSQPTRKVKAAGAGGLGAAFVALLAAIATGGDVQTAAQVVGAALGAAAFAFVSGYLKRERS